MSTFQVFKLENFTDNEIRWHKILCSLGNLCSEVFDTNKGFRIKTQRVKVELTKVGHKGKLNVYTNNLTEDQLADINDHLKEIGSYDETKNGFQCREWLFDVHWYKDIEGKYYTPASLDLVCEIEWHKIRFIKDTKKKDRNADEYTLSAIKYDFQKLLVSNSAVNVLVCLLNNKKEIDVLESYCKTAYNSYNQITANSIHLIACFNKKDKKLYYLLL